MHIYLNPTAIICDLEKLQPAIFNEDFQRRRAGIHSILDEFFESVHRGDDNLAGCNLIHDIWIQRLICSRGRTVSMVYHLSFFFSSSSRATPRKGVGNKMSTYLNSPSGPRIVRNVIRLAFPTRRCIQIHFLHVFDIHQADEKSR